MKHAVATAALLLVSFNATAATRASLRAAKRPHENI